MLIDDRLHIAIQKNGRLSDISRDLLKGAGLRLQNGRNALTARVENFAAAIDFIQKQAKANKPFFVWMNTTRMHMFTHVRPSMQGQSGMPGNEYADGMIEHDETWTWPTGEVAHLPFVTVHRVVDGKVVLWRDYWDYETLRRAAPPGWEEQLLTTDVSWVFDATGLV